MLNNLNDAHEFKPLLSEIEDAPASPLGRFMFWTVVSIVVITVLWLTIGEVDVVVSGRGSVVPEGKVKTVQPLDTGVITQILVKEGQEVKKGQLLMEIDPDSTEPAVISSQKNLDYTDLQSERIHALLDGRPFAPNANQYEADAIQTQQTLYSEALAALNSQLASKRQELAQLNEQMNANLEKKKLNETLLQDALKVYTRLKQVQDVVAKQEYEAAEEKVMVARDQQVQNGIERQQLLHKREQLNEDIALIEKNFRNGLLAELSQHVKSRIDYQGQLKQMGFHHRKQKVLSPVSGTVDQVFIHTVGGVVTPAEKLLTIVPKEAKLQIEAQVDNRDIGFIRRNQAAEIKVDTFEFQKYGTLPGTVMQISSDSHPVDEANKNVTTYTVTVRPEKLSLMVDGRKEPLRTGMSVTTEVKVGQRRIIEFFLNPLLKSLDESVKLR